MHPEQYAHTLTNDEATAVYEQLHTVCKVACDVLGDSTKFPDDWLFSYRWNKQKKDKSTLPGGEALKFVTVGGRTSAYAASRQKKHAAIEEEKGEDENEDEIANGKHKSRGSAAPAKKRRKGEVEEP